MRIRDLASSETGSPGPNGRRIAFAGATAVFAAGAFGGLFGLGLLIGWFDTEDGGIHRLHMVGFGILCGVILTTALVAMTRRPERKTSAFYQVVATAVAALIASLASADGSYLSLGLIVTAGAAILLALHPARAEVLRPTMDPSPPMRALAMAGSLPLVWFGLTMVGLERVGLPADPHVKADH